MSHFHPFILPFAIGFFGLLAILLYRIAQWIKQMDSADKRSVAKNLFTSKTLGALGEIVTESLFHKKIFKVNPLLGWMHMTFAFGWFMLILVGKLQTTVHTGEWSNPVWYAIFFRYFEVNNAPTMAGNAFACAMDAILLFVLSGVALAMFKRLKASAMGLKSTTTHTFFDRFALTVIWGIFPLRFLAESIASAVNGGGSFLTGTTGRLLASVPGIEALYLPAWWAYSIVLGTFFIILPWTRYMHIPAEMVLIVLRKWGVKSENLVQLQTEACSRCGICIDGCAMVPAHIKAQAVYALRQLRANDTEPLFAQTCLDCGSCASRCPVGIDLAMIRRKMKKDAAPKLQQTINQPPKPHTLKQAEVLYFPGCISKLTPSVTQAMIRLFEETGTRYHLVDEHEMSCCGRPLFLSGNTDKTKQLIATNQTILNALGGYALVTSCPSCYKMFKDNYQLDIEVVHHSQWISNALDHKKITLTPSKDTIVYHDPCELGRGCNQYDAPRKALSQIHTIEEAEQSKEKSVCCGGSLSGYTINDPQREAIAKHALGILENGEPQRIVTACPMCKKTLSRYAHTPVTDIAEEVVAHMILHKNTQREETKKEAAWLPL